MEQTLKFIEFGTFEDDCAPTIYPVDQIESIILHNRPDEDAFIADSFKIVLLLKERTVGVCERFYYDNANEMEICKKEAQNRFKELLAQLNA